MSEAASHAPLEFPPVKPFSYFQPDLMNLFEGFSKFLMIIRKDISLVHLAALIIQVAHNLTNNVRATHFNIKESLKEILNECDFAASDQYQGLSDSVSDAHDSVLECLQLLQQNVKKLRLIDHFSQTETTLINCAIQMAPPPGVDSKNMDAQAVYSERNSGTQTDMPPPATECGTQTDDKIPVSSNGTCTSDSPLPAYHGINQPMDCQPKSHHPSSTTKPNSGASVCHLVPHSFMVKGVPKTANREKFSTRLKELCFPVMSLSRMFSRKSHCPLKHLVVCLDDNSENILQIKMWLQHHSGALPTVS